MRSNPVPLMQTANRGRVRLVIRLCFSENLFEFDFFFANAMRFKPMKFSPSNLTIGQSDQSNPLHAKKSRKSQNIESLNRRPKGFLLTNQLCRRLADAINNATHK